MKSLHVGALGAVVGGLLVAAYSAVSDRALHVEAAKPGIESQISSKSEAQPVVVAPEITVPGYQGLVYDAAGRVIAVSVPQSAEALKKSNLAKQVPVTKPSAGLSR